ncbi:CUB domain-containing protein [Aphis craccivora]|uniref:CUB domain-containing protein n=1 Tax=Aphis craccivora TaxID=307492 RepID=A0A6G0YER9_APHCR|nr:CUB domain-containing protein [Aphis craccivora]
MSSHDTAQKFANFRRFPVGTRRDANTRTRVALRGRVRPPVYYCEAGTVTLRLRVPVGWLYTTVPFAFGLRFKFLNNRQASVRLGTAAEPKELGEPVPGTNCSRNFYECYRDKRCSPQSPNYPGMYPRNVTCRYTVRQNMEPKCKHATFSVTQGRQSSVLTGPHGWWSSAGKQGQRTAGGGSNHPDNGTAIIRVTDMCSENDDRLSRRQAFHDRSTDDDPVLLRCSGRRGCTVPPVSRLRSFELDVRIAIVDSDSLDHAKVSACEFTVNASATPKSRLGVLVSPRHAVPPNSTCAYRFQGPARQPRVDVLRELRSTGHFLAFKPCPTRLRIWDGAGTLLFDHCDTPRLCEHIAASSSSSEPKGNCSNNRTCLLVQNVNELNRYTALIIYRIFPRPSVWQLAMYGLWIVVVAAVFRHRFARPKN